MTAQKPVPTAVENEKSKRPASQYYWGDWWKDKGLHSCSLTARGLWHEMNCLMHEGEPYGHLTLNGKPMTPAQLANHCRITKAQCANLLTELDEAGVPSKTAEGVIYSRRMVRDEAIRNARAAGGKAGSEHGIKGAEHGVKGGRPTGVKGASKTPLDDSNKPPPSSSSASSPSGSVPDGTVAPKPSKPSKPDRGSRLPKDWVLPKAWGDWALAEHPHWSADIVRKIGTGFGNHWKSKAGKDATKVDWELTWQNWCTGSITQRDYPPPNAGAIAETPHHRQQRELHANLSGGRVALQSPQKAKSIQPAKEILDAIPTDLLG